MKRISGILVVVFFAVMFCGSAVATVVTFDLIDLGSDSFECIYTIENDSLGVPIEQFTIWFDEQLYGNLQVTTQSPLAGSWDEIILPSSGFGVPLGYDALALTGGIGLGQSIGGFSVTFDWLGTGLPSYHDFEIIDPTTSQTIDFGATIPEPTTLLLFALGGLMLRKDTKYKTSTLYN